ncbi:Iron-sulfur assembly protein 1 [Xylographa soralifera]|nr:Iron-sulfur assembly protein 1 [Xylographa soralifera]
MSLQRSVAPMSSSGALSRFASSLSRHSQSCPHASRHFTSSMSIRLSSKRKLVTASAYHPKTLDSTDLPPRNTGIPDSSIAGGIPQVNDIRPPQVPLGYRQSKNISVDESPRISVTEGEAQKTRLVAETSTSPVVAKSKRPKLRARKAAMNLTPTAISHLRELLEQPEPKLIRVGVKNRGCSGLAYHLEYVEKPGTFDETVEQDGVKVLIDSKALFSIIGSEMDWVEDKLNQRFVFRNPNISESTVFVVNTGTLLTLEQRNSAAVESLSWFDASTLNALGWFH